ncbi:unnamed protein product [Ectocarpus sp. 12 AP-2014]
MLDTTTPSYTNYKLPRCKPKRTAVACATTGGCQFYNDTTRSPLSGTCLTRAFLSCVPGGTAGYCSGDRFARLVGRGSAIPHRGKAGLYG